MGSPMGPPWAPMGPPWGPRGPHGAPRGPHGAPEPRAANLPGPSVSFFACFFETETGGGFEAESKPFLVEKSKMQNEKMYIFHRSVFPEQPYMESWFCLIFAVIW